MHSCVEGEMIFKSKQPRSVSALFTDSCSAFPYKLKENGKGRGGEQLVTKLFSKMRTSSVNVL